MAEPLHNPMNKLPDEDQPHVPAAVPTQPQPAHPPSNTDFSQGPVTGSARITAMNVEGARTAVKLLKSAIERLQQAQEHCRVLTRIQGPGLDPASEGYAQRANANGEKHQAANKQLIANVKAEIDNIQAAIDQVERNEASNKEIFRKIT